MSLIGFMRAYFLYRGKLREAYYTLVFLLPLLAGAEIACAVYYLAEHSSILGRTNPAQYQVCIEPNCLSPKRYMAYVIAFVVEDIFGVLGSVFLMFLSYELYQNRTKSAQLYFRYALMACTGF